MQLQVCVTRQEFIMAPMIRVNQNFARGIFISMSYQEMESPTICWVNKAIDSILSQNREVNSDEEL
jgi:hypothetical protein